MKIMWKLLALASLLTGLAAAVLPDSSFACSCAEPLSVRESAEQAHTVFAGRATDVRETKSPQGFPTREVRFHTDEVFKGEAGRQVTVRTGGGGGDCGFHFETGKAYLVYAHASSADGSGDNLVTGICTRTQYLDQASEDLAELGPGSPPQPASVRHIAYWETAESDQDPAARYARRGAAAAAAVAAGLALWLIILRKRRGRTS